jgi:acyl-coenzyme A synthetase/AMP-(fatty) acid ligase
MQWSDANVRMLDILIDEPPKTASGKIQRFKLRRIR